MMNGHLTVGDNVIRKAFTDCFGKAQPTIAGLTVAEVHGIDNSAPHIRVKAVGAGGYAEGAERFFELA